METGNKMLKVFKDTTSNESVGQVPTRLELHYSPDGTVLFDMHDIENFGSAWLEGMIDVMTQAKKYLDDKHPKSLNYKIYIAGK